MHFKIKQAINFCGFDYYSFFSRAPLRIIRPFINFYYGNCWAHIPSNTKLLFIHIPKNAGTSVVKSLYNRVYGHYPASFYKANDQSRFKRLIKVAIIRNPYDRFYSIFNHYFSSPYATHKEKNIGISFFSHYDTPNKLAYDLLNNKKKMAFYKTLIHTIPQVNWLMTEGVLSIDHLFKFEDLTKFELFLQEAFNKDFKLPHINASKRIDSWEVDIGQYSKKLIDTYYKEDLRLWRSLS